MMKVLGFDALWIEKITNCVCSVNFSILINGEPNGVLKPMQRFRQGDPLSLYLFFSYVLKG